jgi:DNA-directed RNA polymerase subunit M/transcription elongation factor TFIIS
MHTGPVTGDYVDKWKPTKSENPNFKCSKCGSDDVWYAMWESSCGGYEDVNYECRACKRNWWVESADS